MTKQQLCQPWWEAGGEASRWKWRLQGLGKGSVQASTIDGTLRDMATLEGSRGRAGRDMTPTYEPQRAPEQQRCFPLEEGSSGAM